MASTVSARGSGSASRSSTGSGGGTAGPDVEAAEKIAGFHLGGCLLFTKDFKDSGKNWLTAEQLMEKLEGYQAAASVPLLIGARMASIPALKPPSGSASSPLANTRRGDWNFSGNRLGFRLAPSGRTPGRRRALWRCRCW